MGAYNGASSCRLYVKYTCDMYPINIKYCIPFFKTLEGILNTILSSMDIQNGYYLVTVNTSIWYIYPGLCDPRIFMIFILLVWHFRLKPFSLVDISSRIYILLWYVCFRCMCITVYVCVLCISTVWLRFWVFIYKHWKPTEYRFKIYYYKNENIFNVGLWYEYRFYLHKQQLLV